jgi:hypothetical protein
VGMCIIACQEKDNVDEEQHDKINQTHHDVWSQW